MKILFTQYFTVIFQKDASSGSSILNPTTLGDYSDVDMNDVEAIIYHFSDNAYVRQALERDVVNGIKAYQGNIPDEGYQLSLNNGDTVIFSFKVFEPQSIANPPDNGTQTFFAYKLDVVQTPVTRAYAVTVADSENGAVESSHASAEENTTVTLTVKPAQGYALEELIVDGRNVTGEVADNAYSFPMPGHAVTVTAKFKHVCGGAETVPGAQAGCEDGWKEYHKCACGKLYEDAACQNEIKDLEAWKAGDGKIEAVHAPGDYKYDDEKHWKECSCGLSKQDEDKHDFENELDEKCDTCGYVREIGQETFEVTVQTQGNGEADVDVDEAPENGDVRLTIKPADGHRLVRLTVNDQDVTDAVSNNVYTFKMPAGDVQISVLFEEISANTFVVRFDANGGSGQMPEQTFAEGEEQTLTRNAFTWSGYMFIGWNTEPDGSGEAIADGESIKPDKDMTLYAQWQAETPVNPLRIVKHPQDQYVTEGQKAEFSVEAEGDGLTYQWYVDRMDGNGLCVIEGATEKTM